MVVRMNLKKLRFPTGREREGCLPRKEISSRPSISLSTLAISDLVLLALLARRCENTAQNWRLDI